MPNVTDALSYLDIGWSIIPVKRDKRPYCQWAAYQSTTPDREQVEKWWKQWPDANIGAITGQVSGFVAIDIDSAVGAEAYKINFGEIHGTVRANTGKPGGMHLLFRSDPQTKLGNSTRGLTDVDTRGDGGYILVEPSIHPSGRQYSWIVDPRDSPDDLMDLPKDVREWFWPRSREDFRAKKERLDVQTLLMGVKDGLRDTTATRLAGYYLRLTKGDVDQTRSILQLWNERNDPPLERKDIDKCVESISKKQAATELSEDLNGSQVVDIETLIYPDGKYEYKIYIKDQEGHENWVVMTDTEFMDQTGFRRHVMNATGVLMGPIKSGKWSEKATELLKNAKRIHVSTDDTLIGQIARAICTEAGRMQETNLDPVRLIKLNKIVSHDGQVFFKSSAIYDRVAGRGEKIKRSVVADLLQRMGATRGSKRLNQDVVHCWSIPRDKIIAIDDQV